MIEHVVVQVNESVNTPSDLIIYNAYKFLVALNLYYDIFFMISLHVSDTITV